MSARGFQLDPSLLKLSRLALLKKYQSLSPEERARLGLVRPATPQEFAAAQQPPGAPADFGGAVYTSPVPPVVSDDTDPGIPVTRMPTGVSFQKQNATGALHLDTSNPPTAELLQSGARTVGANMGTPTQSGTTVPLYFPGETSPRDVPYEEMHDNVSKYGAKPAVIMKFKDDPDQKPRAVPADQVQDASKAGGTIIPLQDQPAKHAGFWSTVMDDLSGVLHPSAVSPYPGMDLDAKQARAQQGREDDQARQAEGQGHFSRVLNAVGQAAGVNERGMQKAAEEGDVLGVLGHAAAPVIPLVAGEALGRGVPAAADALNISATKATAPVRALVHGANKALVKAPGAVGATIGGTVGAASKIPYGFELGTGVGSILGKELLPQVKLPGEGFGLPNRVAGGPVDAPEFSPPAPPPPSPRTPGWQQGGPAAPPPAPVAEPPLPTPAELRAQFAAHRAARNAQAAAPIEAPPVQAATPAPTAAAPVPSVPAADIAKQLNDALGGKPLQRGVSLRNQGKTAPATPSLPEGFTPADSSAVKGFKYNPDAREFETITQGGQHYIHGDVGPEEAQTFADAESKGKAWQQIRNNPLVAKVIDGKRVAVKPAEMQSAGEVTAKSDAGMTASAPPASVNAPPASSPAPAPKASPSDLTTDWSKALEDLKANKSNLGVERRSDVATRQKVGEMSPEDMRKTLLTSEKTGLPNRRAFDESKPSRYVGMSDADGLKALNDKYGYAAGDALLKAKAEALQDAGVDAYHDKGDEFLQKGAGELRGKMERSRANLRNKVIEFQTPDGTIKKFKGADFSYGIGESTDEAEQGLKSHKAEREARGERARGELRGIVEQ